MRVATWNLHFCIHIVIFYTTLKYCGGGGSAATDCHVGLYLSVHYINFIQHVYLYQLFSNRVTLHARTKFYHTY